MRPKINNSPLLYIKLSDALSVMMVEILEGSEAGAEDPVNVQPLLLIFTDVGGARPVSAKCFPFATEPELEATGSESQGREEGRRVR